MKKAAALAGISAMVAASMVGTPAAHAVPDATVSILGPVTIDPGGETATVRARYVCPEAGLYLWVSAKQVESRTPDKRLQGEGSSQHAAGWWQSHPENLTCDGEWHTDEFTIGTFEYGIDVLTDGQAWVQFCVTNDEELLINHHGWARVVG